MVVPFTDCTLGLDVLIDHNEVFKSFKLDEPECKGGYNTSD
jgi:hypothetical protein